MKSYLYANGEGMSLELLDIPKYHEIYRIRELYENETQGLIDEYLRIQEEEDNNAVKKDLNKKSVLNLRNLGTIKKRKTEKRKQNKNNNNGELILRILRMRAGTKGFLREKMEERAKRLAAIAKGSTTRNDDDVPPVPTLRNSQLF